MASVDDIKAYASSRLGFARSNNFLVTLPSPPGKSSLGGLLRGAVEGLVGDDLSGFIPSIPGVTGRTIPGSRELDVLCKSVSIPGKQILTSDRRIGMRNEKVAYGYAVSEVNMTFHLMNDYGIMNYFEAWQKEILDEEKQIAGYKNVYSKPVIIHQLRRPIIGVSTGVGPINIGASIGAGSVYSVRLEDAFPTTINAIEFSNDLDGLVEVTVSFSYTTHKRIETANNFLDFNISPGQIF